MSTPRWQPTLYIPAPWHLLLAVLWSWCPLNPERTRVECGKTSQVRRGGHWRLNLYLPNSGGLSMASPTPDGTPASSFLTFPKRWENKLGVGLLLRGPETLTPAPSSTQLPQLALPVPINLLHARMGLPCSLGLELCSLQDLVLTHTPCPKLGHQAWVNPGMGGPCWEEPPSVNPGSCSFSLSRNGG